MSAQDVQLIHYPPEPKSLEAAIKEGVTWRREMDEIRWWHGWRYSQIRNKWPDCLPDDYAAAIGLSNTQFRLIHRTAQVFQPEHVNLFPGMPFSMWELVADLAEKDMEEALALMENAYDTPGLTVAQFKELVQPNKLPTSTVPPLYLLGKLSRPTLNTSGERLKVVVELDMKLEDWESKFADYPLVGRNVEVVIRQIKIAQ